MTTDLAARYGTARPRRRRLVVTLSAAMAAVFLGWLAWATWFHSTPEVASELTGFEVVDTHTSTADVSVQLEDGAEARCRVRAFSEDHAVVGEISFVPVQGRNDVSIRTEREATSVDLVGCTTPDQPRPR
ncbi:DUF4307 domain-containing protein [Nocardioides donggukensis]|uniref:DUF4307 domain-containing protein n=1 Tax=Nocardioides donggukensis TaxID=2774019 RepID=A0A927PZM2_9ACTN|nr:DUF4307 domain-containing protein [Nocardioides donggukensis]MBD8870433.1 DUF4307 domain-containing protein [Nocardioides donggukensis]